jgi:energy-converting hydrogenase Eha subunit C
MNAVFAEEKAFQKEIAIVTGTLQMSVVSVVAMASQMELAIAMAHCLPMATIAMVFA